MRRWLAIGGASAVVGVVLLLPTLLDVYKLFEGQYDPLIDRSGGTAGAAHGDPRATDAHPAPQGAARDAREARDRTLPARALAGAERDVAKADAERAAGQRFEAERAQNAALASDLRSAREQIARGFRGRLAASRHGDDDGAALVGERLRRAADPGAGEEATQPMIVRLFIGPGMAAVPDGAAADPQAPAPAHTDPVTLKDVEAAPEAAALPLAGLPDGQPPLVTVRYARGNGPARGRALALGDRLRAEGLDVAGPVDVRGPLTGGRATYYYPADRAGAERVAALSSAPAPVQGRLPAKGRLPRPGTVEIAVPD